MVRGGGIVVTLVADSDGFRPPIALRHRTTLTRATVTEAAATRTTMVDRETTIGEFDATFVALLLKPTEENE